MNVINDEEIDSSSNGLNESRRSSSSSANSDTILVDKKTRLKKGTSNLPTLMHIIKANIGTGVLAM
jgi:hypothetical protein